MRHPDDASRLALQLLAHGGQVCDRDGRCGRRRGSQIGWSWQVVARGAGFTAAELRDVATAAVRPHEPALADEPPPAISTERHRSPNHGRSACTVRVAAFTGDAGVVFFRGGSMTL